MTRRRLLVAAVGGLAAVGVGAVMFAPAGSRGSAAEPDAAPPTGTAAVATRDLVEREELDGTLGYGERTDVALTAHGIITGLPSEGAVVDRGGEIAEVDGRSVRLLVGSRPMWRALGADVGNGPDVRQLEENLVVLGHASAANLVVDDDWTDATTAAVKRWQKAIGVDQTGVVAPEHVVVLPNAVRVAERKAPIGAPATGGPALAVTATEKIVAVDLEASRRDLLPLGAAVEVELPDGATTAGTVRSVSSVVTPPADDAGGKPTIRVIVALSGGAETAFDGSPVDVIVTAEKAEGVLTVPVDALLALAEGGHAVELVRAGRTELVGVETGAFADGYVQVSGDVRAGDKVVVPR